MAWEKVGLIKERRSDRLKKSERKNLLFYGKKGKNEEA